MGAGRAALSDPASQGRPSSIEGGASTKVSAEPSSRLYSFCRSRRGGPRFQQTVARPPLRQKLQRGYGRSRRSWRRGHHWRRRSIISLADCGLGGRGSAQKLFAWRVVVQQNANVFGGPHQVARAPAEAGRYPAPWLARNLHGRVYSFPVGSPAPSLGSVRAGKSRGYSASMVG
jgi:hypothetical protein